MSDNFRYRPGLNNVGNYQVSGIPYVTGVINVPAHTQTPIEIIFPSVTQNIHVHNHDGSVAMRVGFSANGVKGNNYWIVDEENNNGKGRPYVDMRVKTNKIYLLSNTTNAVTGAVVMAELTGITTADVGFDLATYYSGSAGIG